MNFKHELAPLQNAAVVVVSVSYGVAHAFLTPLGLVGVGLRGLLWLSTWRYAYTVLHRIAQGHRELETPDFTALNPFARFPLIVHFLLFPVVVGVLLNAASVPELVRWPAVAVLIAAIPASAALMAMTDNFAIALSPWHLAQLVGRLGHGYLKVLAFSAGLGVALAAVRSVPWPEGLGAIIVNTADVWACLGMFALIGGLIRERRAEFGIPGEVEPAEERAERERRQAWQAELDQAYAALRSGLLSKGYATIDRLIEADGRSLAVHHWLFEAMLRWESRHHALVVGRRYIERLLQLGEVHEALDVFAQCRRISEQFSVAAGPARTLAEYARSIGRDALAEDLEAGESPGRLP